MARLTSASAPSLPARLHFAFTRQQELRYGENPHQNAALYVPAGRKAYRASPRRASCKARSFPTTIWWTWRRPGACQEFRRPAAVIVKHNNPCGTAEQDTLAEAYRQALACDPVSAFGGVMAFNRPLDGATAAEVAKLFVECIVAPGYEPAALEKFAARKICGCWRSARAIPRETAEWELKRISGGVLVQEQDRHELAESDLKVVTQRAPTHEEIDAMLFGWKVCKHVKSNAIVFARAGHTVGVGAGQMSRVDSVKIAVMKAQ